MLITYNLKTIVFPLLNPLSPIVSRRALALLLVLHCIFRPFRPFRSFRPLGRVRGRGRDATRKSWGSGRAEEEEGDGEEDGEEEEDFRLSC